MTDRNARTADDVQFPFSGNRDGGSAARGPVQQFCGDIDIRIDRNGLWHYRGTPIGRKEMVCLFASVLTRDEAGDYWMVTPVERARIQVEDVPFMAVELYRSGCGAEQVLSLRTNIDEMVTVDGEHPLRIETHPETDEPAPYVTVREGLDARIARSVFYELVGLGIEERVDDESLFGVWSSGLFFPIGSLEDGR